MRRPYLLVLVAVFTAALAACSDAPQPLPSAPPSFPEQLAAAPPGGNSACGNTLARQIETTLDALFEGSQRTSARSQFNGVQQVCKNNKPLALDRALSLIQFGINALQLGQLLDPNGAAAPSTEETLASLIDQLFVFVAQSAPGVDLSAFGDDGGIGVIGPGGGSLKNQALTAGIQVPALATTFAHLYAIAPTSPLCLQTDLDQSGPCFDITVYPFVATFAPPVTVVVCQSGGIPPNSALGHLVAPGETRVTPPAANPFTDLCLSAHAAIRRIPRGIIGATRFAVEEVGRTMLSLFTPRPLFAAHGSLVGLGSSLSPYRRVGVRTLEVDFDEDVVGLSPGQPAIGSLTVAAEPPGSILVQSSLGTLTDQPVVLSQGGGNCAQCGGLELALNLFTSSGTAATVGTYRLIWLSLQDKPAPKDAPFVVRDAAGREIARLSYATKRSRNLLLYNGREVGTWVQSVHQEFEIEVDLDLRKTNLRINGVLVESGANFVNAQASSLARLAAEYSGIDAGIVAWDEITATRDADQ